MKHKVTISTSLLVALFLTLAPTILASITLYVNGVSGNDSKTCKSPTTACKTIGHAIALASSGDTIRVAAATYTENLTIGISLNVLGDRASTTIIDGGRRGRVVLISNQSAHVPLSNMIIRNGRDAAGGGISNAGTLTVNSSTISGNTASDGREYGVSQGGGILNAGMLTVNSSTISGNTATAIMFSFLPLSHGVGGGISNGGTLTVSNSTISGNVAGPAEAGYAGGIYNSNAGRLTVNNSTLSGNRAGAGGNIGGPATLQNSIVAYSYGGNCVGTMTSNGYNLSSDGTCGFSKKGDWNNTDPMLGPLQYNGGPTKTMALPLGSPAIDAGNPLGCRDSKGNLLKTDQRGMKRPDKEDTRGCDIGAYERQSD